MSYPVIRRFFLFWCAILFASFIFVGRAECGGLVYAFPPELRGEFFPVARISILSSETFVSIQDVSEEHSVQQTFMNDNEFPLESVYIFPLPANRSEHDIRVSIDGVSQNFTILEVPDLQKLVRNIVQKHRDHELLELWGERAIIVRHIHLESRETKILRILFRNSRVREAETENIRITTIGERYSKGPVKDFSIWVKFKSGRYLRSNLSMTHQIAVTRESPNRGLISVKERNNRITGDFELLTTFGGSEFNLRVLNQECADNRNYFMLMLEPPVSVFQKRPGQTDMDVAFLVDSSGSIGASQLDASKAMILHGIERLRESDKFNLLSFNSRLKKYSGKFINATVENKSRAHSFIDEIEVGGGSDLFNPILNALESFNSRKRSGAIVLFTDCRPTVGVTNVDFLIDNIRKLNKFRSRIFIISVGDNPNILMMEKLSTQTGGKLITPSSHDSAQSVMERVFNEISSPTVTDASVEYSDIYPEETFPESLLGAMGHETFFILGNYDKSRSSGGKITAKVKIQGKTRVSSRLLSSDSPINDTVRLDLLWAMRKFGKLLERESLKTDPQTLEKLAVMSRTFGFVNPFQKPGTGKNLAETIWTFNTSFVPSRVMAPEFRHVKDHLFRLTGGRWVDNAFRSNMPSLNLEAFSDEYFDVLEKDPELAKAFCLGPSVTVARNGKAIITGGR